MGDLVNDAVQESQNASNPEYAQAWMDLAREMPWACHVQHGLLVRVAR